MNIFRNSQGRLNKLSFRPHIDVRTLLHNSDSYERSVMRFRILQSLSFALICLAFSACTPRRMSVTQPTRAFETKNYVVVQTAPDRFLVLTKSNVTIEEIQKRLGCGRPHVCSGQWKGEMWTIERLSNSK